MSYIVIIYCALVSVLHYCGTYPCSHVILFAYLVCCISLALYVDLHWIHWICIPDTALLLMITLTSTMTFESSQIKTCINYGTVFRRVQSFQVVIGHWLHTFAILLPNIDAWDNLRGTTILYKHVKNDASCEQGLYSLGFHDEHIDCAAK